VDVIQHSLNLGAFGVFEAARQAGGVKVIGLAVDQKPLAPEVVLSTVILDYAKVYEQILTEVAAGKKGGYMPMSLAGGTSYLAPFYGEVPDDIVAQLDALEQQLINGEIDVPTQADLP
jgi:basic membrane lipoprotein Med (substrate-binding protein (PBP1-ABC) superfamily)